MQLLSPKPEFQSQLDNRWKMIRQTCKQLEYSVKLNRISPTSLQSYPLTVDTLKQLKGLNERVQSQSHQLQLVSTNISKQNIYLQGKLLQMSSYLKHNPDKTAQQVLSLISNQLQYKQSRRAQEKYRIII